MRPQAELTLPRVIVSRPVVFLMFVLTVLNFCIFYGPNYITALFAFAGYDPGSRYDAR